MKIETAQRLVAEAAQINGHVPLYGERATYEVRELKEIIARQDEILATRAQRLAAARDL